MVVQQDTVLDKPLKQMLKEFEELKNQITQQESNPQILETFLVLKASLLSALEQKELESYAEIERSKTRKNMLARKLDALKQSEQKMRDEIIKEMEEYNRIKRFRHAQLASIQRNIDEIKKQ
ncbi:hypothetical protein [Candidatus Berkiella aquae]|uniref:Uncharacterized protein n=1 Tax=Candidatus Berkiella aquae TaxID=295108 RepID=A0A0Q9YK37_9GAMM|nr:hypothetical protein [Candidatus Berkiella aquae]MCS5709995.1 hypothetical protein [Candidatus Berkiella aquae]